MRCIPGPDGPASVRPDLPYQLPDDIELRATRNIARIFVPRSLHR